MYHAMSCRSVEQQHWELSKLAQAVVGPLKCGLQSFISVSEILLGINGDMVLPGCQNFCDIRSQIENMKLQMVNSEQIAKTELRSVDEQTEGLTAEQSNLAEQKKMKERELGNLKTQLESHRSSLESYKKALGTEKRNLRSAEDTLDTMRRKRDEAEILRNVGIGIMFIPIVGLIPGAIMAIAGEEEMKQASDAVCRSKKEIERCETEVRSYSNKVSDCESQISQAQRDIQRTDRQIQETQTKLWDLSEKRRVVADIQAKVRQAVHQLGRLCVVGNVAELQTRYLVQVEPLMRVMEDMTAALGQMTGDDLLHTQGVKSLMFDIRKNHSKLKELTYTSKSSDNDYY